MKRGGRRTGRRELHKLQPGRLMLHPRAHCTPAVHPSDPMPRSASSALMRSWRMTDFATLPLKPALLASIETHGYAAMTPVQAQSLPPILAGRDVIAQARTGSGKTAAFGLGLLQALDVDSIRLQALVLCPTRELADQVSKAIRRLAAGMLNVKLLTLCGGMPL